MRDNRIIVTGVVLLVFAWISAGWIPGRAQTKFFELWGDRYNPSQAMSQMQIIANAMMLQSACLGGAGLVCLGFGIAATGKQSKRNQTPD
jgi:hypothetical protein